MSRTARAVRSRDHHSTSSARRSRGFTLVELMIVVALIGVLAAVSVPNMQRYGYRAKRAEAMVVLEAIFKAQLAHYVEYGQYGDTFDEIDFKVDGAVAVNASTLQSSFYTYTVSAFAVDGMPGANFQAVATGDIDPSDDTLDILMIENDVIILE